MKLFYRLLNFELRQLLKPTIILSILLIMLTLVSISIKLKSYVDYNRFERYELLYTDSGGVWLFIIALVLLLIIIGLTLQSHFHRRGKSIYTLLTLPMPYSQLYIAKVVAAFLAILLLICMQLVAFIAGYYMMEQTLSNYSNGEIVLTNGLYLAFLRLPIFHFLFPKTLFALFIVASSIGIIITTIFRTILSIVIDRHLSTHLFLVPVVFFFTHLLLELQYFPYYYETKNIIFDTSLLLIIAFFFIVDSWQLFRKGAIV